MIEKDAMAERKTILDWARFYIFEKELSAIPLEDGTKKAAVAWGTYQNYPPGGRRVEGWWKRRYGNIALVTGKVSGNLVMIGPDSQEAFRGLMNILPHTPTVESIQGGHFYLSSKKEIRNHKNINILGHIADVRGEGGYAVAPPSIHPTGKQYRWMNGRGLDDLPIAELPEDVCQAILSYQQESGSSEKGQGPRTFLKDLYQGVSEGGRNDSLARLVGSWANDGLSYEDCLKTALAVNTFNNPPLDDKEVESVVKSIIEKHHRDGGDHKKNSRSHNSKVNEVNVVNVSYKQEERDADKKVFPEIPFPLHVFSAQHQQNIIAFARALHAPPDMIACARLPVLGAAIGNTVRVSPRAGWEHAPFVWHVIIRATGGSKTPSIEATVKPVRQLQAGAHKKYEEKLAAVAPRRNGTPPPTLDHYLVSDTTIEALADVLESTPRGVLNVRGELSGWLGGFNQFKKQKGDDAGALARAIRWNRPEDRQKDIGDQIRQGPGSFHLGGYPAGNTA